jgi:hypothetical protein
MTLDELVHDKRAVIPVPEAGAVLGLGRSASYAAVDRGDLPVLTLGRRRVVPRARLLALLGVVPDATSGAPTKGAAVIPDPTLHEGRREQQIARSG